MNLVPGLRRIALYSAITSAILGSIGPVAFAHTQVKETLTVSFYGNGYPHAALNTIVSKFRAKYPQYNVKFDFITAGSWADYFRAGATIEDSPLQRISQAQDIGHFIS